MKFIKKNLKTNGNKKEIPQLFYKAGNGEVIYIKELENNQYVCPETGYHVRIGSKEYFKLLLNDNQFTELFKDIKTKDPLNFVDIKTYQEKLQQARKNSGVQEAIRIVEGYLHQHRVVLGCMDFNFIGGSMGMVVGKKITSAVNYAIQNHLPLIIISKSGGARMMEGSFSLMQMAKVSAQLLRLAEARLPYISVLTDPTTGGVSASFAMLGDIQIAEPGATIGFAGARVIQNLVGKKTLPKDFQSAEQVLQNGFLDCIVHRKKLKGTLNKFLKFFQN